MESVEIHPKSMLQSLRVSCSASSKEPSGSLTVTRVGKRTETTSTKVAGESLEGARWDFIPGSSIVYRKKLAAARASFSQWERSSFGTGWLIPDLVLEVVR